MLTAAQHGALGNSFGKRAGRPQFERYQHQGVYWLRATYKHNAPGVNPEHVSKPAADYPKPMHDCYFCHGCSLRKTCHICQHLASTDDVATALDTEGWCSSVYRVGPIMCVHFVLSQNCWSSARFLQKQSQQPSGLKWFRALCWCHPLPFFPRVGVW